MDNKKLKNTNFLYVSLIYLICFFFRFLEYFFIRTDSTFFGEAFIHKLIGIFILFLAAKILKYKSNEIGFARKNLFYNLFKGFSLGFFCFFIGYFTEILILRNIGEFNNISLFVTTYSVNGNIGNRTELIFFGICILGNIINVVMEEGIFRGLFQKILEKRYNFWISAIISSVLFGFWHCIGPIRSFIDGTSNKNQMIISLIILIGSSTLIGLKYEMMVKLTGSLFAGMADHFVNNTIVNILHVVGMSEIDQLQTIRISIAQTVSFIIILIIYIIIHYKSHAKKI